MKWIHWKTQLPKEVQENGLRNFIWCASFKTGTVQLGYYSESMKCFFSQDGTGISVSHWQELKAPPLP